MTGTLLSSRREFLAGSLAAASRLAPLFVPHAHAHFGYILS
ncbi:MAG: hypothetical protein AAB225_30415 [Acidobacteriota bacterium]